MSQETIDYGIHLGTEYSSIALFRGGDVEVFKNSEGLEFTPSAVFIDKNAQLVVGQKAKQRVEQDPENSFCEFKLQMGTSKEYRFARSGRVMKPEELSAEVLKSLKGDVQQRIGEDVQAAVITVPAAFELPQCEATQRAAELAGFSLSPLLQEPVAAAIAYGFQSESDKVFWLVYDFGGGTFDAAVIQVRDGLIQVVNHGGDNHLGGKLLDWEIVDQLLVPEVQRRYNLPEFRRGNPRWVREFAKLKYAAEEAKIEVSRRDSADIVVHDFCAEGSARDFEFELKRLDVQKLAEPFILRSMNICKKVLEEKNLAVADVEKAIVVGDSSFVLMPHLQDRLSDAKRGLGIPLAFNLNPLTTMARGAAIFAAKQLLKPPRSRVSRRVASELEQKSSGSGSQVSPKLVLRASDAQIDAICQHGIRDYPAICCGILIGHSKQTFKELREVVPAKNVWHDRASAIRLTGDESPDASALNRCLFDPLEQLRVEKGARERGLEVLGYYRSHPDSPACPTDYDLRKAWPWYSNVIVEVQLGKAKEILSWVLTEDRSHFTSEAIEATPVVDKVPSAYILELTYGPSELPGEMQVEGCIAEAKSQESHGFTIEFIRDDVAQWRSGELTVAPDGKFKGRLQVFEGVPNPYCIQLRNKQRALCPTQPSTFTYSPPARSRPVLNYLIGAGLPDNKVLVCFQKGTALPAKFQLTYTMSKPIQRSSKTDFIRTAILEGMNTKRADRNRVVGSVGVSGNQLAGDLTAGTQVIITLEISAARAASASAHIPSLKQTINGVFSFRRETPGSESLKKQVDEAKQRLQMMKEKVHALHDEAGQKILDRIERDRLLAEVDETVNASEKDHATAEKCVVRLLNLQTVTDEVEDAVNRAEEAKMFLDGIDLLCGMRKAGGE